MLNERYSNSNGNHKYVMEFLAELSETGSVANSSYFGQTTQIKFLVTFTRESSTLLCLVAQQIGMSHKTLRNVL